MIDAEVLVKTGDRGKPPFDCSVRESRTFDGKPVLTALSIAGRLLAFDEGKDIERIDFQHWLLNRVQEDLEIVAIAQQGVKPAPVSNEFEIGICLWHSQRDI